VGTLSRFALRSVGIAAALAASAAPGICADRPLRAPADVDKPAKAEHVDPVYPEEAKAKGVEGVVLVGFTVDAEGRVHEPRVLSGHVLLDEAALAAVRQWRYRPTRKDGRAVTVEVVETVPFWLGPGTKPEGWPAGASTDPDRWITWPPGQYSHLKLEDFGTDELPPPSTLHVYRGSVRNVTKQPLARVVAAAVARETLNGPKRTTSVDLGDIAPGEERAFELRPEGHQVTLVFGQVVDGEAKPLATLRQVKTMTRVLASRPVTADRTQSCLASDPPQPDDEGAQSTPRPGGNGDRPPRVLKNVRPEYPKPAFDAGVEGTVLVEFKIDAMGAVTCARLVQSLPGTGLDQEALKTIYGWRFSPAIKAGKPVPTIAHAPVTFRIY
jgi:TonB family protein